MFQSTHPRGVRLCAAFLPPRHPCVSIHAPTRGATILYGELYTTYKSVSIHAPTRGATSWTCQLPSMRQCFNPRTHEGCDLRNCCAHHARIVSIHAPTRGATMCANTYTCLFFVSIHAPTRGATAYSAKYRILIYKSSHFANINQTITFKVIKSLEFL